MSNAFCCSCSSSQEPNMIAMNMQEVQSMEQVDDLIAYIDQFLRKLDTESQEQVCRPNSVASSIDSGGNLIEKLSKRLNWHVCKKPLLSALDRETRKVLCDVLREAQIIPYLGMALCVIGHTLERAEQASFNKDKCLDLMGDMSVLAKHMKNLEIHLHKDKLNDILLFIVKGTLICARQMEPHRICRFIFAPLDAADLENLKSELERSYPDLQLKALTKILNRLSTTPGPSQGEYPHNAVGIEEAQNEVIELLNLRDSWRRVMVIYGIGGIGKTTLATAVFRRLDLTGYHYCRIDMEQDSKRSDLPPLQEQILRDLFEQNWTLNNCTQGREKLSEAFGKASKPIFLYIDNGLRQADLETLLPIEHLSRLPMKSRILVTTRNLNETDIFGRQGGIQFSSHRVDSLPEREAKRLLCRIALGDANLSFHPDVYLDGLLKVCGGIPLYLKIVGSQLSRLGNTVSASDEILKYHEEWQRTGFEGGEDHVRESIVDFVYRRLTGPSKEAFLDVTFFYYNWERNEVADMVGGVQLQELEAAALVTTSEEKGFRWEMGEMVKKTKVKVKMHDIVRARGRKLSAGNRIINTESLAILLCDEQALELDGCHKMSTLFYNFKQLKCLKFLSISHCKELKTLPDNIAFSASLAAMKAYGCSELEAKAMDSLVEIKSLMFLEMGESPMLIRRWQEIQQHRPLIGAALRFEGGSYPYGKYPYAEIMSTMFFNDASRFLHVDGDGQLAEVASSSFPDVGVKVSLLFTACHLSNELRETLLKFASRERQIVYVDVDGEAEAEAEAEGSDWVEEREKRIREALVQLPEGSRAWTCPFHKTTLLFAYSLWEFTRYADTWIVGTTVLMDEEGRRKLSHPLEMIFRRDGCDARRVDLSTLFLPLSEAWKLMRKHS